MDKISLATYGLSRDELDRDLSEYYNRINNHKAVSSMIEKKYASVEDYIDILYILKFVRKYSNSEMGELTGKRTFSNVYMQSGLHWEYQTNDFDECMALYQQELSKMKDVQQEVYAENFEKYFSTEEYKQFFDKVYDKIPNSFLSHCNYTSSKENFVKELYYLWEIKHHSIREIAVLYNRTPSVIHRLFPKLGIAITQAEANMRASESGRRDYSRIFQNGRKTTMRSFASNGLFGSKAENVLRTLIESTLFKYVDPYKYETIIGINSRNVIAPLEVDIPIVVICKNTNRIYKFAIELDGEYWHRDRSADEKISTLKNHGWLYMPTFYGQELVNNGGKLNDVADDICKKINTYINE